jgi:hypothetical protein
LALFTKRHDGAFGARCDVRSLDAKLLVAEIRGVVELRSVAEIRTVAEPSAVTEARVVLRANAPMLLGSALTPDP